MSWALVAGLISVAGLFWYSYRLFGDLEKLMEANPESHPTTIYSDVFLLKKGDIYAETFLTERLKDLRIEFHETPEQIDWKGRDFNYPIPIMPPDAPALAHADEPVHVTIKDGRVESITIGTRPADEVAIEPELVATMAGSSRSIKSYVPWDQIPAQVKLTVMATEDQRFLQHIGFDLRSLARALWADIRTHKFNQGGSTITQQLVKNLLGSRQKTIFRKVRELILAILMDVHFPKEKILEKYLNEAYFGQVGALEVHGVAEAAHCFYNKRLDQLTQAETALLTGLLRGPIVYSPYKHLDKALERKNVVLKKMAEQDVITRDELKAALAEKIVIAPPSMSNNHAPYFIDYVKSVVLDEAQDQPWADDLSAEGLRIFTTLDLPLQRRADQAVASSIKEVEARYKVKAPLKLESVLVAADQETGFVRALVGGRSYAETTFNRVLNMKRQVGSTFKPIAYLAALLKGTDSEGRAFSGAYMVDDSPWSYKLSKGKSWTPKNYEKGHRGRITLREAFANSINIPMAKIGVDIGIENVIDTAHKVGITTPLPNVPSLVLGSVDLGPMELLTAYSTLANRGSRAELATVRVIDRCILDKDGRCSDETSRETVGRFVTRREPEVDPKTVDVLNSLLASVVKEGTAKLMPAMGYEKPARGKTGTTNFSRDAWFAGFSQGLVAVTWTGFDDVKLPDSDDPDEVRKYKSPALLTGAGAALPTWARFFSLAKPSKLVDPDPQPDATLERIKIDRTTGLRAKSSCPAELVYEELFLPGAAPSGECTAH